MSGREPKPGVLEGQTLTGHHELRADVCIVGSGAGGGPAAAVLAAAGLKVIVLEEGGYFTANRFRMREEDCYVHLYQEAATRSTKDLSLLYFQGRSVGGGTTVNWTTCFRTPARVVDHWRERWDVKGFSHDELVPHWESVEERLNIHEAPRGMVNRNNQILWDGCEALGLKPELIRRNVRGCASTGYCGFGCPINAKQGTLLTYLPDAMAKGATVVSRCRVDRLLLSGDKVSALEGTFLDALGARETGATVRVVAPRFILSAGAIGTPAILLRSGAPDPHERAGLRSFLHPVTVVTAEHKDDVNAFYGAPQTVSCHSSIDRGDKLGFFLECAPLAPSLGALSNSELFQEHEERMHKLPNTTLHIALIADGFHEGAPGGRVHVHPSGRPYLDYTPQPAVFEAVRAANEQLARVNLETGAVRTSWLTIPTLDIHSEAELNKLDDQPHEPVLMPLTSAHQMGGAGMSDDPTRGVVRSEDLRHHQLQNLHVIDGSVYPTSLGVNPQLSIYGLSHLISSRLAHAWT
jgi:choline dehydrogenase